MSTSHAVADHSSESYPEFSGRIHDSYIDGYDPVSFSAPHSSLLRTSTWVGMGLILSLLPAAGILLWGLGTHTFPSGTAGQSNPMTFALVGAIAVAVVAVIAIVSITVGRKHYRSYRKETGRIN